MANKNSGTCCTCRFDTYNGCTGIRCKNCEQNLDEPVYTDAYGPVYCKCLTIEEGEECPYYEEVT